jgi:high affinity cGMP-specific 3',5'-cyclic phosphodiesterase 9
MTEHDFGAMLLACFCHDYEHPGYNNLFMTMTNSELAIRYNDKSVLENHHVAATFNLLQRKENNIFSEFSTETYKETRETMITLVIATDMAYHFNDQGKLKNRLASDNFDM